MYTMEATNTLQGKASQATEITYTIHGLQISGGVETYKKLGQGQLTVSMAAIYTVPASTETIVRHITLVNNDTEDLTVELCIDGTAEANRVLPPSIILAGGWAEFDGGRWYFYNSNGQVVGISINHYVMLTTSGAVSPTTNGAAKSQIEGTNFPYYVLDFDKDTDESVFWEFTVPGNMLTGNWTISVWWKALAATSGTVYFTAKYGFRADDEVFDAALSTTGVSASAVTTASAATKINTSTITIAAVSDTNVGKICKLQILRDVSEDTMAEDARMIVGARLDYVGA